MSKDSSSAVLQKIPPREDETIAAIATPVGSSGIGIVRLSGSLAELIVKRLFRPKTNYSHLISHQFRYGEIVDPGKGVSIDEVLLVFMKAPKTYTREDMVEIQCHGGYFILQKVLELALSQGARMAQPGEFTKRAFLNGRIDLTQAEAVIDTINAKTMASLEIANQQLRGLLYQEMTGFKEKLVEWLTLIEAHIDFPDEEIEPISYAKMRKAVGQMIRLVREWIASYEEGKVFHEGISCAIVGKTNVGKSSLLNVLLREERAIVTPIPGTTRDVIEEVLNINGIPVRLMDTAGLRKTMDSVEMEGVRRTKERVAGSDFVLLVLDGSCALDADDQEVFGEMEGKKKVVALNKCDLPSVISQEDLKRQFEEDPVVSISALQNRGIDDLKRAIFSSLIHREVRPSPEHLIVANIRHKTALERAEGCLQRGLAGLEEGASLELIAFEFRSALEAVGEMVGETTPEEVLNRIFDQFCIGK